MKKLLSASILAASLLSANAEAHPLCAVPAAVGSMGGSIIFTGGMAAFAALPVAIVALQPYNVWNHIFPVVEQRFPGDRVVPKPVYVKAARAHFYPYQDETGVHTN